jgi:sulfonate transport system substrate-binding protein
MSLARTPLGRRALLVSAVGAAAAIGLGACGDDDSAGELTAGAALPDQVPPGTKLAIGDKEQQKAIEFSGAVDTLPFQPEWANISGGPQTLQAFRAKALDIGSVADIPPIHSRWTNIPTKIVAARFRKDPINHPIYQLGIAPGVAVNTVADLRGKKIAYSPGQAQGALVIRVLHKAGLSKDDVQLVELASVLDAYPNALASHQVDVAPLGGIINKRYLAKWGRDGARVISHGLRDDPSHLYAPVTVLEDPAKAAAIREYVKVWSAAWAWRTANEQEWIDRYYVKDQGLTVEDGTWLVDNDGTPDFPDDWTDVIARHQETIDLLADFTGNQRFDAAELYDRRFEPLGVAAFRSAGGSA